MTLKFNISTLHGTFELINIDEVTKPKDGYICILDSYWEIREKCVLGYRTRGSSKREAPSPQCNKNKAVVEKLKHEDSEVLHIPVAYWQNPYNY